MLLEISKEYLSQAIFLFVVSVFLIIFGLINDEPLATTGLLSGIIFLIMSGISFSKYFSWKIGLIGEEILFSEIKK